MTFRDWIPTILISLLLILAVVLVVGFVVTAPTHMWMLVAGLICWALFLILLIQG